MPKPFEYVMCATVGAAEYATPAKFQNMPPQIKSFATKHTSGLIKSPYPTVDRQRWQQLVWLLGFRMDGQEREQHILQVY